MYPPRGAAENGPRLSAGGNFVSITVLSPEIVAARSFVPMSHLSFASNPISLLSVPKHDIRCPINLGVLYAQDRLFDSFVHLKNK